ncbi:MAG: sensor histidine kinase [Candidatus Sumerlaeaceae bacterium]
MRARGSNRSNKLFLALVALLTVCSLALLVRLLKDFEQARERRIADLQRVFSDPALLRPDQPVFSFGELESEVHKYERQGELGEMTVARRIGNEERVVYPYFLPAIADDEPDPTKTAAKKLRNPLPWKLDADVRVLPLLADGKQIGTLYVRLQTSSLKVVRSAIGSLIALLVASITLFLMQFRRQEITITRTTIELEQKTQELVRLERLALAGQISANIFHDLKKPMLNIKNEADEFTVPGDASLASRIRLQVDLFFQILRDTSLERFVRASEECEYVDVNEIVERSLALVKYEKADVTVRTEYAPTVPPVFAEPVRLVQVISNLVLNGYQALGGRGTLTLRTSRDASKVIVQVEDNGPGIPADKLSKIFQPFYTTKEAGQGTGLGLYIADEILREAGGSIQVESVAGRTCFTVTLPAAAAAQPGAAEFS